MHQLTFPISGVAISFAEHLIDHYREVEDSILNVKQTRQRIFEAFERLGIDHRRSHTNSIHFRLDPQYRRLFDEANLNYDVLIKGASAATPIEIPTSPMNDWIRMSLVENLDQSDWFKSAVLENVV